MSERDRANSLVVLSARKEVAAGARSERTTKASIRMPTDKGEGQLRKWAQRHEDQQAEADGQGEGGDADGAGRLQQRPRLGRWKREVRCQGGSTRCGSS